MEIVLNSYGCQLSLHNQDFLVTTDEDSQNLPAHGVDTIYVWQSQAFMLDTPLRKELASRVLAKLKGEDEEDAGVNHLYQLRLETQRLAQIFKSFYKKHKDEKKR